MTGNLKDVNPTTKLCFRTTSFTQPFFSVLQAQVGRCGLDPKQLNFEPTATVGSRRFDLQSIRPPVTDQSSLEVRKSARERKERVVRAQGGGGAWLRIGVKKNETKWGVP